MCVSVCSIMCTAPVEECYSEQMSITSCTLLLPVSHDITPFWAFFDIVYHLSTAINRLNNQAFLIRYLHEEFLLLMHNLYETGKMARYLRYFIVTWAPPNLPGPMDVIRNVFRNWLFWTFQKGIIWKDLFSDLFQNIESLK